jgi:hypothetical protein
VKTGGRTNNRSCFRKLNQGVDVFEH